MSHFKMNYYNEVVDLYKAKNGNRELTTDEQTKIQHYVDKLFTENFKDTEIEIYNETIQNLDEQKKKVPMIQTYDSCRAKDYIFSLSHGVFKPEHSKFLQIWDEQKTKRDETKNKMKAALKNKDFVLAHMYDGHQNVKKRVANAMYGAFN